MNMLRSVVSRICLAAAFIAAMTAASTAWAQDFPSKPVKIIVQTAAGSSLDVMARLVAEPLSQIWGQQAIIVNQAGAGGLIASRAIRGLRARRLHAVLGGRLGVRRAAGGQNNLPFDVNEFVPIGFVAEQPYTLLASNKLGVNSVTELIELSKRQPGGLDSVAGTRGGLQHLTVEWFRNRSGAKLNMIHYPGAAQASNDVIAGRVPMMMQTIAPVAGIIAAGEVKLLAVTSDARLPNYPDTPTVAETIPGFTSSGWSILVAPKGTPPDGRAKDQRRSAHGAGAPGGRQEDRGARQLHAADDAAGAGRLRARASARYGGRSSSRSASRRAMTMRIDLSAASAEARARTRMQNGNRFKLGLFGMNCSGSVATTAPERWNAGWPENREAARLADAAGIEFLLPIARWLGYGGSTDRHGTSFETLSWASALLAATKEIVAFATVHVPLVNPVFAAKSCVTADHVGRGRFGLNVVSGWNVEEFAMFGAQLLEHDDRYGYSEEWVSVVKRIWSEEKPFDYSGKHFNLKNVGGKPKPWGGTRPLLMSAGSSPAGRAFASRHVDCLFMVIADETKLADEIAALRAGQKRIGVFASGHLMCRATPKETKEYYHYLVHEKGDWEAAEAAIRKRIAGDTPFAAARSHPRDDGALHQRRRHLSGDRQLRRGGRDIEAAVRCRSRRHGARLRELRAGDADHPRTKCCRASSGSACASHCIEGA